MVGGMDGYTFSKIETSGAIQEAYVHTRNMGMDLNGIATAKAAIG
jgi:hypothetical protein